MQELLIISGMSGSGKTIALRTLEDLDFYCVDNLPVEMFEHFVEHISQEHIDYSRVAIGIDIRSTETALKKFPAIIEKLKEKYRKIISIRLFFLSSDDKTLLKRYSETRRSHPLSNSEHNFSLSQAIRAERELLESLAIMSDLLIDTSKTTAPQLRDKIWKQVSTNTESGLSVLLQSFAFKRGFHLMLILCLMPDACQIHFGKNHYANFVVKTSQSLNIWIAKKLLLTTLTIFSI